MIVTIDADFFLFPLAFIFHLFRSGLWHSGPCHSGPCRPGQCHSGSCHSGPCHSGQGRRPRGTGGRPPKFEMGDGPCIRPPNILRSSVVGCAQKYEQSKKKGIIKEFFSEIVVFLVKKGS